MINLKPTISYTSNDAISTFSPKERGCYSDGEIDLNYLKEEFGFSYEMNNCLFDQGIRDIIWNCRCIPTFVQSYQVADYLPFLSFCTGQGLKCSIRRGKSLGKKKVALENDVIMPDALMNPNKIGNISKPKSINCLPSCKVCTTIDCKKH